MAESPKDSRCQCIKAPFFPLCFVYFTASWGRRMWTFALALYLLSLAGDEDLLLTAIYGFSTGMSALLLGGLIGKWIDSQSRLTVVFTTLLANKLTVCVCTVALCLSLHYDKELDTIWDGKLRRLCQAIAVILAVIVDLSNMAYKFIALEKDWFVVVTSGDSGSLANLNAFTRSIDLCANILAPITTGYVMTYGSKLYAGILIIGWFFITIFSEYFLLRRVYHLVPGLSAKHKTDNDNEKSKELELLKEDSKYVNKEKKKTCLQSMLGCFLIPFKAFRIYHRQTVFFAGLSLAFLYVTVLGFDGITTAYINANGISESIVGVSLAMGSLAGIIGSFLFTRIRQCVGLELTGMIAFLLELCCLSLCVISIWLPGSPFDPSYIWKKDIISNSTNGLYERNQTVIVNSTMFTTKEPNSENTSIIIFLVGVITSRIGLWMADLVVAQLFQENIPEHERGIVNGMQNSLNSLMDMFKFTICIILPHLPTFGFLILLSFTFIFIANCLFAKQAYISSEHSIVRCLTGKGKRTTVSDETVVNGEYKKAPDNEDDVKDNPEV